MLATCSSDKTIRIHQVSAGTGDNTAAGQNPQNPSASTTKQLAVLKGHGGPVWQIAWSHPIHNSLLASCSYDGKVIIWNTTSSASGASIVYEHDFHQASVNAVAWAPHEYGLVLACASSDGQVSVLQFQPQQNEWQSTAFTAHSIGVNSVSFCPAVDGELQCVTGGCDNLVKVWRLSAGQWQSIATLEGHADWVRSVAWSPLSLSSSYKVHTIASCSPDKTVCIWTSSDGGAQWQKKQVITLTFPLWRVSWSVSGHLLAIAGSSDSSLVYAVDSATGQWAQVASQPF